jgi:hypothetical protein
MPVVDIDRFFHGAAPELVYPQSSGLTDTGPTKESDMYAFGVLAWEVSPTLERLINGIFDGARLAPRFFPGEFRSPMRVGSQESTRC